MKKYDGAFTNSADYDKFIAWKNIRQEGELWEIRLDEGTFKTSGTITFDETTPHGTTLQTDLVGSGWIEDTNYNPNEQADKLAQKLADEAQRKADQKAEQDIINDTENKPRIILALDELPYHERTKTQYDTFSYDVLRSYFTLMVSKQNLILEIISLKYDDSILIDEVKQIQSDIKLKQKTIERIDLSLIENPNLQSLLDHKATLESEILTLQTELTTKASSIRTLIKSHWDIEGAKTSVNIKLEIESLRSSDE